MIHAICDFCGCDCDRTATMILLKPFSNFARHHSDVNPFGVQDATRSFVICSDCMKKHDLPNPYKNYNRITAQQLSYSKKIDNLEDEAPSIDPIHASGACYCGECKYRNTDDCATRYETSCGAFYKLENDKDFCSYGERKRREKGETDMDKGIEINIPLDSYPIEVQIDVLEDLLAMLMTARDVLTEMEKR